MQGADIKMSWEAVSVVTAGVRHRVNGPRPAKSAGVVHHPLAICSIREVCELLDDGFFVERFPERAPPSPKTTRHGVLCRGDRSFIAPRASSHPACRY